MVAFVGPSPFDLIPKESFNKVSDLRVITNLSDSTVKLGVTSAQGVSQLWDVSKGKVRVLDTLHAKAYLFDSSAVVTSANLSAQAFNHKVEIGVLLEERSLLKRLEIIFEQNWKIAREISRKEIDELKPIEHSVIRANLPAVLNETGQELREPLLVAESPAILVNITWNSKGWTEPSSDPSHFQWVREGMGTPHESWNFDFNNRWSTDKIVRGFFQTHLLPRKPVDCVFFYSTNPTYGTGFIVGVYGGAKVFPYQGNYEYNIEGDKSISVAFHPNAYIKVDKKRHFPLHKKRIGRVNYLYLNKNNVASIVEDALLSHKKLGESIAHEQIEKLERLKEWLRI